MKAPSFAGSIAIATMKARNSSGGSDSLGAVVSFDCAEVMELAAIVSSVRCRSDSLVSSLSFGMDRPMEERMSANRGTTQ